MHLNKTPVSERKSIFHYRVHEWHRLQNCFSAEGAFGKFPSTLFHLETMLYFSKTADKLLEGGFWSDPTPWAPRRDKQPLRATIK